jgi:hypothetical protein
MSKPFMWIRRKDDCGTPKGESDMTTGFIMFASMRSKIRTNVATVIIIFSLEL